MDSRWNRRETWGRTTSTARCGPINEGKCHRIGCGPSRSIGGALNRSFLSARRAGQRRRFAAITAEIISEHKSSGLWLRLQNSLIGDDPIGPDFHIESHRLIALRAQLEVMAAGSQR